MKKIIFFYLFTLTILNAQNYWKPSVQTLKKTKNVAFFTLDKEAFRSALKAENSHTAKRPFSVIIPDYEGNTENFHIQRSQILSPELAQKYPNIKCFVGYSSQNPLKKIRFVWSDFGLNAIIEENFNYSFIQATQQEGNHYKVYLRDNSESPLTECKTTQHLKREKRSLTRRNSFQTSSKIRTFRIAIAATYDYTNFFGGKSRAFAQIVHSINRINQIFGAQLSIQFQLVSDENVIYDSPFNPLSNINYDDWDVYSDTNPSRILQDLLDAQVGETNYDIGHLFHNANLGGNAGCIGCVCESKRKGTAFSSVRFRRGMNLDHFDVDVLCHEIGHQMGAYHTYSHKNEGTGSQKEPGSGSTIMGYAGAIEDGNIQLRSDAYFHHQSVYEITNNVLNKQCAIVTESSNAAPEIGDIRSHTIPKGTAFLLEGRATDPDGDPLLYTWEQSDSRNASHYFFSPYSTQGAIARSLPPSASTQRYIPRLSRIVSGKLTQTNPAINAEWETILNVGRTLNWSFMVMDRNTSSTQVGNTAYTTIQVAVVNSAGPFEVISHNSPNVWFTGQYQTIIWDVAKTNEAEVNEQEVNVLFSTDGGLSFPHILASKIPNNGKAKIKVPATIITDNGRFMIKAANNIFLAVNKGNINVKMDEDTDGDGITSSLDNCPHMPNPDQADLDNDGIGDLCDDDIDGDDVPNQEDNCLDIPNPNQSDLDNDGIGDLCDDDMDNDGYTNEVDNCPKVYNPDQADLDNDGIGDLCDNDIDGDGIDNQNDKSLDYVLISNAFTPNGDGNNDFYTISRVENYPNNELLIYNQFGQLVYHSKGYKNQWNGIGLNGNKVPQGSYFYIFTLDNTEVYKRQGWLFINY